MLTICPPCWKWHTWLGMDISIEQPESHGQILIRIRILVKQLTCMNAFKYCIVSSFIELLISSRLWYTAGISNCESWALWIVPFVSNPRWNTDFLTKTGWNLINFVWCRVPMNIITCGALMCLHIDAVSQDKRIVFAACLALSTIGQGLGVPDIVSFLNRPI